MVSFWKHPWFPICLSVLGFIFTLIGILSLIFWDAFFNNYMNQEIQIEPSSMSYPIWKNVTLPLYMEFYMFNWDNPQDIYKPNVKPKFSELGPYVFREKRLKIIKAWVPENDTVTFLQNRTWEFDQKLSHGSLDDKITTIDSVAVAAAYALRNSPNYLKTFFEIAMIGLDTKYYVRKTVREFIFEGYDDPLLNLANSLPSGFLPINIPFKKFAWMSERNGVADYDGVFNMYTGVNDISKVGSIANWNYANETKHYGKYCDATNGTAGEIFPPYPTKTSISLFSPDFCRSVKLAYKDEVKVDGIDGYRYWGDEKLFANSSTEPSNYCFCSEERGECWPNGVLNITSCKWGAPAFASLPHFLHGDPVYRNAVEGMLPDEGKHQSFVDLEIVSGFPLQVNVSFQINILLQPMKEYLLLKNMPRIIFPILWFKQTLFLDSELRDQLEVMVFFSDFGFWLGISFCIVGPVLIILAIIIYFRFIKGKMGSSGILKTP